MLGDEGPCLAEQRGARAGQRGPAGTADKQLNAQLPFQRLDRLRYGGLAKVQPGQAADTLPSSATALNARSSRISIVLSHHNSGRRSDRHPAAVNGQQHRSWALGDSGHCLVGGPERSWVTWSGGVARKAVTVFRHGRGCRWAWRDPPSLTRIRHKGAPG